MAFESLHIVEDLCDRTIGLSVYEGMESNWVEAGPGSIFPLRVLSCIAFFMGWLYLFLCFLDRPVGTFNSFPFLQLKQWLARNTQPVK